jgi:hypothetical protein
MAYLNARETLEFQRPDIGSGNVQSRVMQCEVHMVVHWHIRVRRRLLILKCKTD